MVSGCRVEEDTILADVDSHRITGSDFTGRYHRFLQSTGIKDRPSARKQLLDGMISEILLRDLDDNMDIFNDPEYMAIQERVDKELLLAYYRNREIDSRIDISEEELRKEFVRVNQQVSVRHLFTRNPDEAEKLYLQLKQGMTFEQLAPLVFEDDSLAANGGYLGYFSWGDLDPDFEEAAYSLPVGQISPPVQTQYGYSILRVEDRIARPLLTESEYTAKKNSLRRLVYIRKRNQVKKQLLKDVLENLNIVFDEPGLNLLAAHFGLTAPEVRTENSGTSQTILSYREGTMSRDDAIRAINELAPSSKRRISDIGALKTVLKGLVVQDWLLADAKRRNYDAAPEFLKQKQLWSAEKFLQFKRRTIFENMSIPDSSVRAYYEANRSEFLSGEMINVQEIVVASETDARGILDRLDAGEEFGILARSYSLRPGSAENDGVLGLGPLSQYGDMKSILAALPSYQVVGPVKTGEFFVIARIIERKESRPLSFDEVSAAIRGVLKQNEERQNFSRYAADLRDRHYVKVNEEQLMALSISDNKSD